MTSVTPTDTGGLQNLSGASASSALGKTSADFNMFLKMLTTQMQNQDPLSPMDTSQYTQQLVQYSQVEQSIQQTGTLKDILSRLTTQDMAQASSFIGREAQFDSTTSGLMGDTAASWGYTAAIPVQAITASITDANGTLVDTRTIAANGVTGHFSWDGKLASGKQAPDGAYTVAFSGTDASGGSVAVTANSIGTVKEVVTTNGAVSLGVNGVQLPASALMRVSVQD